MRNKELLLEISYQCNQRCIHCSSVGCHNQSVSKNQLNRMINHMIDLDDFQTVRLSGGEPLLIGDLIEYVKLFKNHNVNVVIQTNGAINTSHEFIKSLGDVEFWVSLYGNQCVHNSITQDNTFHKTRNFILYLMKNNYKLTIQSPIFNEVQYLSLLHEMFELTQFDCWECKDAKLRLSALLNHGKCNFAFPIKEQIEILKTSCYEYPNTELSCSLTNTCDFDQKLVIKPDGALFHCASHKHNKYLCKK